MDNTPRNHPLEHRNPGAPAVGARRADVSGEGIRVDRAEGVGVAEARARFGGMDLPATFAGLLAALGFAVVLAGVLGAIGARAVEGSETADLALGGAIGGLVTLLLSFLVGGWVAGRMARYDGGRNGVMTAVWFLLLTAGLGVLGAMAGARADVFDSLRLPSLNLADAAPQAIAGALVAVVVCLLAAYAGGKLGERYHRRADAVIAATQLRSITIPDTAVTRERASR